MNESIMPTLPLTTANQNDGMFGGAGSWVWIILIFLLLGGRGGFGNWGNEGVAASPATNLINNDFLYTQQKIDALGQAIINQTTQINSTLCQGFGDVRMGIADLGFRLADCCCTIQKDIQGVNFQSIQNTCDITNAINSSTQAIKDLINGNTMQDLRDKNNDLNTALVNANQTSTIINQLRPYPTPSYLTIPPGVPYMPYPTQFYGGFDGHRDGHRHHGFCEPCGC